MCGIVSIFNIQEQTPELRQQALRMSQKIRHRGQTGVESTVVVQLSWHMSV